MLTIARLRLKAWKCYREEVVLDLEAKPYAIFARVAEDEQRSNWAGKSSLCEAVDFALYGRLVDEFKSRKRGWISRGEKSGEVDLTLSDGSRIVRSQTLAGSEKLWYFPPGKPNEGAVQAAAQQKIDDLVGLSREDFAATRYFRQGEMARLITLDPGPRLDLVAGWLRLGPLQDCEDEAAGVLRELARRRDEASGKARAADEEIGRLYERVGLGDACALGSGPEDIGEEQACAESAEERARAAVDAARSKVDGDREREASRAAAEAYERTVEQGKALADRLSEEMGLGPGERLGVANLALRRTELAADLDRASADATATAEARGQASREAGTRRSLLAGEFDGRCPLAGAPCPSRAFVDDAGRQGRAAFESATAALRDATERHRQAEDAQRSAAASLSRFEAAAQRLGDLRAEASRLRAAHERWQALSEASAGAAEARAALASAEAEHVQAQAQVAALRVVRASIADAECRRHESRAEAERLERAVRAAAAAVAVFGKGGAQRRMAEGALTEIQDRACEMMAAAAVPLSVEIRWSREGSGAASSCAACGDAFPKSERVKTCGRCGEARGQQIINRLEVEPSAQSGGARDLCGIFVQLAAAEWLAADRESRWSCAMLDEPTATLDAAMRRGLASHLPALLRESNCSQAFVIAHTREILGALPGQIEVVSEGGWSKVRVLA